MTAHALATAINEVMPTINAVPVGPVVKLRYHTPADSSGFAQYKIYSSSFGSAVPIPVEVTQFSQLGPTNYSYPLILPVPDSTEYHNKSGHTTDRIATPNTTASIEAPAIMEAGVSDVGIHFTPGENLTPFDESRIYIDPESNFYLTGTAPTVLPGFSERLSSKTSFVVNLEVQESTSVYWSTGSNTQQLVPGYNWMGGKMPAEVGFTNAITVNAGVWPDANGATLNLYRADGSLARTLTAAAADDFAANEFQYYPGNDISTAAAIKNLIRDRGPGSGARTSYEFYADNSAATLTIWNNADNADGKGKLIARTLTAGGVPVTSVNATGTTSGTIITKPNSGLCYYSTVSKKWEPIGDLTTGSNVDYGTKSISVVTGSLLAVNPATWWGGIRYLSDFFSAAGYSLGAPCDTMGFPAADKFNATGSHLIKMSDYITGPFLLEKVVIEISGSFALAPLEAKYKGGTTAQRSPAVMSPRLTVMLLNEFGTPIEKQVSTDAIYNNIPLNSTNRITNHFTSTKQKDIIAFGRIGAVTGPDVPDYSAPPIVTSGFKSLEDIERHDPAAFSRNRHISLGTTNQHCHTPEPEAITTAGLLIVIPEQLS